MISEIKSVFNNHNKQVNSNEETFLDKTEWINVTNSLIKDIDIDKYSILKYKQDFHNTEVIENVINHKESHSHSVIYINPSYKLKRVDDAIKVDINNIYQYCISCLWKSNLISTSDFEDKLFFILSLITDNDTSDDMIDWSEMVYYIKKKSVNDVLQKFIWETYKQIFDITKPIFVDIGVAYFTQEDWEVHKHDLLDRFKILSNDIKLSKCSVIAFDERQIEEKGR